MFLLVALEAADSSSSSLMMGIPISLSSSCSPNIEGLPAYLLPSLLADELFTFKAEFELSESYGVI